MKISITEEQKSLLDDWLFNDGPAPYLEVKMSALEEARPFPISSIRNSLAARLEKIPVNTVVVAVDGKKFGLGLGTSIALSVMTKVVTEKGHEWSFMGYLAHTSKNAIIDEAGFELRWKPNFLN